MIKSSPISIIMIVTSIIITIIITTITTTNTTSSAQKNKHLNHNLMFPLLVRCSPLSHSLQSRSSKQHWAHKNGLTWVKITMQFHRRKCHHNHQHYQHQHHHHQHHHHQQQRWAHKNGLTCLTNTVLYLDFGIFDTVHRTVFVKQVKPFLCAQRCCC